MTTWYKGDKQDAKTETSRQGGQGRPLQRVDVQYDTKSKSWSQVFEQPGKEPCRQRDWHMHRPQRRENLRWYCRDKKAGCGCRGRAWEDNAGRRERLGCAGPGRQWWSLGFMLSATKGERWDDTCVLNLFGDLWKVLCEMGARVKTFKRTSEQKRLRVYLHPMLSIQYEPWKCAKN